MSDDIVERLRTFDIYDYADADKICREAAARIAKLEAALHKIADRTKRAHPQAQEGEIYHIAITALAGSTK